MTEIVDSTDDIVDLTLESDSGEEEIKYKSAGKGATCSIRALAAPMENKPIISIEGIPITNLEVSILKNRHEWLTDEIINAYTQCLMRQHSSLHCCSTFFFTRLQANRPDTASWLCRWRNKLIWGNAHQLLAIPINWSNTHWALAVYHRDDNTIRYYDSLMDLDRARRALALLRRHLSACNLSLNAIELGPTATQEDPVENSVGVLAFISSKLSRMTLASSRSQSTLARESALPNAPSDSPEVRQTLMEMKTETPSNQPQQIDGSSCGVYTCWWIGRLAVDQCNSAHTGERRPPAKGAMVNPMEFRGNILDAILSFK